MGIFDFLTGGSMPTGSATAQPTGMTGGGIGDILQKALSQNQNMMGLTGMGLLTARTAEDQRNALMQGYLYGSTMDAAKRKEQREEEEKKRKERLEQALLGALPNDPLLRTLGALDPKAAAAAAISDRKGPTPTDEIREYQFDRSQWTADPANAGKPFPSFGDWKTNLKKAGAINVNTNVNTTENKFDNKLAETDVETYTGLARDYGNAKADLGQIKVLRAQLEKLPGGLLGNAQAAASRYGIKLGENATNVEAADAIISQLVPKQRIPGSGTTSDRDIELFRRSVPQLSNSPEGNRVIVDTMEAMATYRLQQGEIANRVLNKEITREEGRKLIQALPDPFQRFHAAIGGADGSAINGAPTRNPAGTGPVRLPPLPPVGADGRAR